ncbi:MAG TPA: phosphoribosylformylglycinamidine synthase I [Cytophagales bacterium]|nr:phosphoribosylformylglycinamidine synthase I [Cytophagales bacterium]HAA19418.1 phosphoribosylformylglycinamidine synthase I [Cytophagales bacterium]HAP63368.1 phosphoribosylformylglycinamidine synthase I [Cytophagales bacterium]
MKFGVVIFPGSNCDADTLHVLGNVMQVEVVSLWHKDHDLQGCDFIVLPGGFSYGDYLRSGSIARFSPIMNEVVNHAQKGGYVMGICNGFQVLTEAGLLPGALLHNSNQRFICKNIHLKPVSRKGLPSQQISTDATLKVPIAHGEGNYFIRPENLKKLQDQDQILFRYCDADGNVTEAANPNGSVYNIAGVMNEQGNVFGMMPHPERASEQALGNTDGRQVFESILSLVNA